MTTFATVTAYAIEQTMIPENEKAMGFVADSLDEKYCGRAEVHELSDKIFVVFAKVNTGTGEPQHRIMTTALGEVATYKTAGAALEAIKMQTFSNVEITIKKLAHDTTPADKKARVARYKTKFAERVKSLGNAGVLQLRIDVTSPGALKNELLERKDAITAWVASVSETVADLKTALAADGIDADTLVY